MQSRRISDGLIFAGVKSRRRGGLNHGLLHFGLDNNRGRHAQLIRQPFAQGAKFHLCHKIQKLLRIRIAHLQIVNRKIQLHIALQLNQLFGQFDLRPIVHQAFAALGLFDLSCAIQKLFQRAIFVDQQSRSFNANAGCTGHIVNAVPCQSLHINHALRGNTKFLNNAVSVNHFVFHGIQHHNTAAHQLHQVLVRADDGARAPSVTRAAGQCCDDVIRFKPFDLFTCHIESPGCRAGEWELWDQIFRRGGSVRLVQIIHIIAKCLARVIKDHRNMGGSIGASIVFHISLQHVAKPGHSAHRQTV